jgi:hypothetical protein
MVRSEKSQPSTHAGTLRRSRRYGIREPKQGICFGLIGVNVSGIHDECITNAFTIQDQEVFVILVMRMIKIFKRVILVFKRDYEIENNAYFKHNYKYSRLKGISKIQLVRFVGFCSKALLPQQEGIQHERE